MIKANVKYYADQINIFTPCKAVEKKNTILVISPDGKKKRCSAENSADSVYRDCANLTGRQGK